MKRAGAILAITAALLLACGGPASGDGGCGGNTSPCGGAGKTLPKGWSVTTVKLPDGRSVTCVVVNLDSAYGRNAPAMSCDWTSR